MSQDQRRRLSAEGYRTRILGDAFDGLDLSTVHLDRLRFERCTFLATDLRHATLDGCWFKLCVMRRSHLRGASLRGAIFAGCDLSEADLRDCDLTGARFGYVNTGDDSGLTSLAGALTNDAILRDATFERVVGWPPN